MALGDPFGLKPDTPAQGPSAQRPKAGPAPISPPPAIPAPAPMLSPSLMPSAASSPPLPPFGTVDAGPNSVAYGQTRANTTVVVDALEQWVAGTRRILEGYRINASALGRQVRLLRAQITKVYGSNSPALQCIPNAQGMSPDAAVASTRDLVRRAESLVRDLKDAGRLSFTPPKEGRVFIGHGRSLVWRDLKDFISDTLGLTWDEFNRESAAGVTTSEHLSQMLSRASFAFLVMTAEDEHSDQTLHARENVVHEFGLFQGKLGPKRAISLLEYGCSEFSNIVGLGQIRFPKGDISARFEKIREVLEREGLC